MKIGFMGTPNFAVPILKALHEKYEVVFVVSQPNRVKKKGVFLDTPVASLAKELGLPLYQPEHIKDELELFLNLDADILVTAAYGQYLPSKLLKHFKHSVNVHASLLPYHRGGAPIQRCLMNGDTLTGVTITEMAKRLDTGKIYSQVEYEILPTDNSTSLFEKLSILGRDLLLETIEDIYSGKNEGVEQDEALATFSSNISVEEEKINLNQNTKTIINQIRGLSYEPGAYLLIGDIKLKVFQAKEVEEVGSYEPGYVISTKKRIVLKTKDSAIELLEVLYPGKKSMTGKDFSNGQRIFVEGTILKS